ncbi:MAG: peptidylprolyl isomerase [Burkholderiales bacterium]
MKRALAVAALAAAFAVPCISAAQGLPTKEPAKPAAAKDGPVATVNGVAIPRQRAELIVRQQTARGGQDSEQLRVQVREMLINNEIVFQEANRGGFAKKPEVQHQLELARQEVIINAYVTDYLRTHPVSDADVQKEYDRARAQTGDKEYKARHILVGTEEEAKSLLADLKKGAKFDELAQKNSKDEGTRSRGGDLDWNVPGVFDKAFADALLKLEKGRMTEEPVRSRFGFHVIRLDDVRALNFPPLAQVKPQIQQRLTQQKVEAMVRDLRTKAKVE